MKPSQMLPFQYDSEHDDDDRLVRLVFGSRPALQAADINPWLTTVDSSDNALRAVEHAAGPADEMNASALHLIHVQPWLTGSALRWTVPPAQTFLPNPKGDPDEQ